MNAADTRKALGTGLGRTLERVKQLAPALAAWSARRRRWRVSSRSPELYCFST